MQLGRHAIIDGKGAERALLNDRERLEAIMVEACEAAGATVLSVHAHEFEPHGVTIAVLLAESHATIHSFPEHGSYSADVFTCGQVRPDEAAKIIVKALGGDARVHQLSRG